MGYSRGGGIEMPTYRYRCRECGEEFSKLEKKIYREGDKNPSCPKCNSKGVIRLIGIKRIIFKGEGWTTKQNPVL